MQWQKQTKDENNEEDLRAQVEPDLRLHPRPSQGFPQPHAGADGVGPTQVTWGGQHLYGRGSLKTLLQNIITNSATPFSDRR